MPNWAQALISAFPNLANEEFKIIGDPTDQYNCIAYAAGDSTKWWWPDGINYWPSWATLDNRMESLKEVFAGQGYEQCHNSTAEEGYQKVALYGFPGGFEHAALQMPNGPWRSKMGQGPIIEHHSPESLSDGMYGSPTIYMRRSTSKTYQPE